LRGKRDHDPHFAPRRRRPERRLGVSAQKPVAAEEDRRAWMPGRRRAAAGVHDRRERGDYRIEVREHPSLAAAERGQPEWHQRLLQPTQVVPSQRDVGREIDRARQECAAVECRPPRLEQPPALPGNIAA
jgi:hypothetical protein